MTDTDNLVRSLERAVATYDHPRTTELCNQLIEQLRSTEEPFPALAAKRVLSALRRKRQFHLMAGVADALLTSGRDDMVTYRQYAQALLDLGLTGAALDVLAARVSAANDPAEKAELRGLVGRAHKDRYIATAAAHRSMHLEAAVAAYHEAWREDPTRLWHGINAVALLSRAARDGVTLEAFPDPGATADRSADEIIAAVGAAGNQTAFFDLATVMEANVALGRFDEAHEWLDLYVAHRDVDAFELASTLRQLTEVWNLTPESEPGSTLLPVLQAELLARADGGEVTVGPSDVENDASALIEHDQDLEKVFGQERFTNIRWFKTGLDRCRGVARIEDSMGDGIGTGFLVEGPALHPSLPTAVLLTNAHVIPDAIRAEDAIVAFRGLEDSGGVGVRVRRMVWSSSASELDTTVLELEQAPDGVVTCPLASGLPPLDVDPRERVYVIGHPSGRPDLRLSILDNHLLDFDETRVHYRAPTEPGSSGSPVMNKQWAVIALHHSGDSSMPRLHGEGVYQANEGIRIDQVQAALQREL